jgi:phytol kinase
MRFSDLDSLKRTEQTSIEKKGLIVQAIYFQVACVVLLSYFWGFLGVDHSYFASLGSLSWGFGDTTAGVLGTMYGKKKYRFRIFDHRKTVEGSISMIIIVFFVALPVLESVIKALSITLLISLSTAFAGAFIEAVSRRGIDTLTVPLSISYVSYWLFILLGAK